MKKWFSETYNKLFTMHGVAMIFFFLVPSIPAVLGNFLIPLMIGAKDLAFPKLNLLSWYLNIIGAALYCTLFLQEVWTLAGPFIRPSAALFEFCVTPPLSAFLSTDFRRFLLVSTF